MVFARPSHLPRPQRPPSPATPVTAQPANRGTTGGHVSNQAMLRAGQRGPAADPCEIPAPLAEAADAAVSYFAAASPDDRSEREADQAADRLMRMPQPAANRSTAPARTPPPDTAAHTAPRAVQEVLATPGRPLDPSVRAMFEPRFGQSFAHVRIHDGAQDAQSARAINARAYTFGRHLVFDSGQFDHASSPGRRLIAHELAHVVQQAESDPAIQRMRACPPTLHDDQETPSGWQAYHGDSTWFHCGFLGILEDRSPTPGDPQNECFYDHSGALVDENHPFAGCRGTPNEFDSSEHPLDHTFRDSGGIWQAGGPAFVTSRVYTLSRPIAAAIQIVETAGGAIRSITEQLGTAIALGVLTASATVDPGNWSFQGFPARSIRHLNVMGALIGSAAYSQNVQTLLTNLTRRLDSFAITGLLDDIAQDVNQARQSRPGARPVTPAELGTLSVLQLVEWLRDQGLVTYNQPPEQIARQRYDALRAATPPAQP